MISEDIENTGNFAYEGPWLLAQLKHLKIWGGPFKKWKGTPLTGRRYLEYIYLTKGLLPEHIKNPYNSIRRRQGNSLAVQWLGLHASTAGGMGLIPRQGTKIPQATWCGQKKKKKKKTNKMAKGLEQILCKRRHRDGHKAHEKMLKSISHWENEQENHHEISLHHLLEELRF